MVPLGEAGFYVLRHGRGQDRLSQEPQRVALNQRLVQFGDLLRAQTAAVLRRALPAMASVSEQTAQSVADKLMDFHDKSPAKFVASMRHIAADLLGQDATSVSEWSQAEVQQGLKVVLTVLASTLGTMAGVGVPDRAAAIISEWAVVDPAFHDWAKRCADDNGSAWSFAAKIVLFPVVEWLNATWVFLQDGKTDPGTLETALSHTELNKRVDFQVMQIRLHTLRDRFEMTRRKRRPTAAHSSSENESGSSDEDRRAQGDDSSSDERPAKAKKGEADEDYGTPPSGKRVSFADKGGGRKGRGSKPKRGPEKAKQGGRDKSRGRRRGRDSRKPKSSASA